MEYIVEASALCNTISGYLSIPPVLPGFPLPGLFQHDSPGKHCRRRKARTVFSDQQLNGLEKRFEAQKYLSTPERVELASQLSLSETQVRLAVGTY